MNTHDVLAYAVAQQIVRDIRAGDPQWSPVFSPTVHTAGARGWPIPDFVLQDAASGEAGAAEFKPPDQTKREYLTGLGQAVAYTRDFHYSLLVVPDVADDDFQIGAYLQDVLTQSVTSPLPVGLVEYDPRTLSSARADLLIRRPLTARAGGFARRPPVESSFYAKWRDASPQELARFLELLYEEGRKPHQARSIRDRAFDRLWVEMTSGRTLHWGGQPRRVTNRASNREAWGKNYRNFVTHIGWCGPDGKLTEPGLEGVRVVHLYGANSRVFLDFLARSVLSEGKHLVLLNAINELQDAMIPPKEETKWLSDIELGLEHQGLLKRNPGRHGAAVQNVARGFLKAEKTLWRNLELITPRGTRVFHPGRGFIFDWSRITSLLGS
ncbi:MAG TPA: hypothetical protein VMD79_12785 [Solirubrobacteraceae bacterium]|nr:hypothetical protein [Solirubrobacteraceae bacterium]